MPKKTRREILKAVAHYAITYNCIPEKMLNQALEKLDELMDEEEIDIEMEKRREENERSKNN